MPLLRVLAFTAVVLLWARPASASDSWPLGGSDGSSDLNRLSETSSLGETGGVLGEPADRAPGAAPSAPPPPPAYPEPIPVDGSLSLLALAGVGYAARRLRVARPAGPTT